MNNVINTKVCIFRNLKDFKFVPKLESGKKEEIVNILSTILPKKMKLLHVGELDEKTTNYLKENNLLSPNCHNLFVSDKDNLSINLFSEEHLTIISTTDGFSRDAIKKAEEISNLVSQKVSLAYSDDYGYIMSDLKKIGSGLFLNCTMALPALSEINKIEQLKSNLKNLGYLVKPTKKASIFEIETICNLGLDEEEIFDDFEKTIKRIEELEVESAKMIDVTNHDDLLDKTARSTAILSSAYLLTYDELNNMINKLRIAKCLNLCDISVEKINKLQKLAQNSADFISASQMKELANKTKEIIKGE